MPQLLNKEVWVENDWLSGKGGVIADNKTANGIARQDKGEKINWYAGKSPKYRLPVPGGIFM